MTNETEPVVSTQQFRSAITTFIHERRDTKLKGKDDPVTAAKYEYEVWLASAAKRVGQIQAVTHVLKATHPDAKGSSLHIEPATLPQHREVGSHLLGSRFSEDVVGNAAALDVFKFLKMDVAGRRLFDWMQAKDPALKDALNADEATAESWMAAFSSLVRKNEQLASHSSAKQLYWCVGEEPENDSHYQLLQPLFSSSLAHAAHAEINDARFGEGNKIARQAFRKGESSEVPYRDYRGLAVRKLGGTKPQNISQLNSERGGINYLLASLPPTWQSGGLPSLLRIDSAFERFLHLNGVRGRVQVLAKFLLSNPPSNKETRNQREAIERAIGDELPTFSAQYYAALQPGWTRDNHCELPLCEQLWLDSERIDLPLRKDHEEEDQAFIDAYHWGDWQDQVAARFANWLNAQLTKAGVTNLGDSEFKHWAKQALIEAEWPVRVPRKAGVAV